MGSPAPLQTGVRSYLFNLLAFLAPDKCIVNAGIEELDLELKELLVICFLLASRQLSFAAERMLL